jgi:hypothetical protein
MSAWSATGSSLDVDGRLARGAPTDEGLPLDCAVGPEEGRDGDEDPATTTGGVCADSAATRALCACRLGRPTFRASTLVPPAAARAVADSRLGGHGRPFHAVADVPDGPAGTRTGLAAADDGTSPGMVGAAGLDASSVVALSLIGIVDVAGGSGSGELTELSGGELADGADDPGSVLPTEGDAGVVSVVGSPTTAEALGRDLDGPAGFAPPGTVNVRARPPAQTTTARHESPGNAAPRAEPGRCLRRCLATTHGFPGRSRRHRPRKTAHRNENDADRHGLPALRDRPADVHDLTALRRV